MAAMSTFFIGGSALSRLMVERRCLLRILRRCALVLSLLIPIVLSVDFGVQGSHYCGLIAIFATVFLRVLDGSKVLLSERKILMTQSLLPLRPPKGMRDYGPEESLERAQIRSILRGIFSRYGFLPLETPAMEQRAVLGGQYGEEGEQLIFYVLNSGDFLRKISRSELQTASADQLRMRFSDKALRYDLTVPMARFVAAAGDTLPVPFKRYQIQPVWRADRPQRGRYREFYQCDVDIVGSNSLLSDAEIITLAHEVCVALGLKKYELKINHRGLLKVLARRLRLEDREKELCLVLDKLDKVGIEGVEGELAARGFPSEAIAGLRSWIGAKDRPRILLEKLHHQLGEEAKEPIAEIRETLRFATSVFPDISDHIHMDPSLARGLSYYTGLIFEGTYPGVGGSLFGGGRYDRLVDLFATRTLSGIGLSFGLDRMYELINSEGGLESDTGARPRVLIAHLGSDVLESSWRILYRLRAEGLSSEHYPSHDKLKKQFLYAEKKKIPYLLFAGSTEERANAYGLKQIATAKQQSCSFDDLVERLSSTEDKNAGET